MMTLALHYVGGDEPCYLNEVCSYAPLRGWFVVYFDDGEQRLYPTDRIEEVEVFSG